MDIEEALKWADQPLDRVIECDLPVATAIHTLAAAYREAQERTNKLEGELQAAHINFNGMSDMGLEWKAKAESLEALIAKKDEALLVAKAIIKAYNGPTVDSANAISSHIDKLQRAIDKAENL